MLLVVVNATPQFGGILEEILESGRGIGGERRHGERRGDYGRDRDNGEDRDYGGDRGYGRDRGDGGRHGGRREIIEIEI